MSGRRSDDERGEVFQGGGPDVADRDREIGVGAAVLGADPGRSSADSRSSRRGNASTGGQVVPVAVPEASGMTADADRRSAARSETGFDGFNTPGTAGDAEAGATPVRTDSATRLNTARTSPTGVDRGGHVHRIDLPKTPAQGGYRDALSPAQSRLEDDNPPAAGIDVADDAAADSEEPADLGDLTGLAGPHLVGRRLHLARRQAGLSVEAVTAVTRIRATMIRQIEAGDFSRSGGEVYARGHVRTLAKAVGLDAEELLGETSALVIAPPPVARPSASTPVSAPQRKSRKKDKTERGSAANRTRVIRSPKAPGDGSTDAAAAGSGASVPVASVASAPGALLPIAATDPSDVITREPKSANWTAAMLVVLLGLVVFAGMQLVGDDKPTPTAPTHVPPPAAKPAAPRPPVPTPTGVAVKVAAAGADSWLAVFSADGRKLYDNLLAAGQAQSFQDNAKLEVVVGNAAAIKLQLNGKDMAPIGGDGEVVRVRVNPTGVVRG